MDPFLAGVFTTSLQLQQFVTGLQLIFHMFDLHIGRRNRADNNTLLKLGNIITKHEVVKKKKDPIERHGKRNERLHMSGLFCVRHVKYMRG